MNASQSSRSMLVLKASHGSAKLFDIVTTTFARSASRNGHVPVKRFQLSGRYFQNPLRRCCSLNAGTVVSAQRIRYAYGGSHVGIACGKLPQEAEGAGSIPATSIQRTATGAAPSEKGSLRGPARATVGCSPTLAETRFRAGARGLKTRPVWQPQAGYSRSLKDTKRKRSKRSAVANADDERKTQPCSPQGQIHHSLLDAVARDTGSWKYRGVEQRGTRETSVGIFQRMAKKSCPVLEHKQDGMGKRLRSGPEMRVRVLNGQVSQRLLQNCVLRTPT